MESSKNRNGLNSLVIQAGQPRCKIKQFGNVWFADLTKAKIQVFPIACWFDTIRSTMSNLISLTSVQLRRAARLQKQIETLNIHLAGILTGNNSTSAREIAPESKSVPAPTKPRKKMSAATRAKIAVGAKARWAEIRAERATTES